MENETASDAGTDDAGGVGADDADIGVVMMMMRTMLLMMMRMTMMLLMMTMLMLTWEMLVLKLVVVRAKHWRPSTQSAYRLDERLLRSDVADAVDAVTESTNG